MTRHSSGNAKRCFDSPCVDCLGGLRMSQLVPGKKGNKAAGNNQTRKRKNSGQTTSTTPSFGKKSSWGKKKNNGQNFKPATSSTGQGGSSSCKLLCIQLTDIISIILANYCHMHGNNATHPWEKCHLNRNGSNFNAEKAVAWAQGLKKKSDKAD